MAQFHEGMVAVATGKSANVARWTAALENASIPYAIAHCHYKDPTAPVDHVEIWVDDVDVERAREVIRAASYQDKSLMW